MYVVMLVVSVGVFGFITWTYLRSPMASIFHPMTFFLSFHGLVFVLRPIIAWIFDYRQVYRIYQFNPSMSEKITALGVANLGLICFAFVCMHVGGQRLVFLDDPVRRKERQLLVRVVCVALAICAPVGIYSLLRTLNASVEGTSTMVFTNTGYKINTEGVGYLTDAVLLLVTCCSLFAWYFRFRLFAWLPIIVFFLLKAATGGRGPFVIALTGTMLFYFYDRKVRLPGVRLLILAAVVGSIFSTVGQDRGLSIRQALGVEKKVNVSVEQNTRFLEGMDFATMEYVEFVVHVVPERSGTYDYFLSNLQVLTEPIPRVLWPGKPIGPPIDMVHWWDYGKAFGLSMTVAGIGWYELGWIGVVIWSSLWGLALGRFYRWFATGPQDAFSVTFYMAVLPMFIVGFRDGTVLTVIRQTVFYIAPVLLIHGFARIYGIPNLGEIRMRMAARAKRQAALLEAAGVPVSAPAAATAVEPAPAPGPRPSRRPLRTPLRPLPRPPRPA